MVFSGTLDGIYQLAAYVNVHIARLPPSSTKSEFKGLSQCQNIRSPSFPTVQMIEALIICILTWKKHNKLLLLDPTICYTTILNILRNWKFPREI